MSRRRRFHEKNQAETRARAAQRSLVVPVPVQVIGALLFFAGALFLGRARLGAGTGTATSVDATPTGATPGLRPDDLSVQMHQVVIPDDILALRNWNITRPWRFPGLSQTDTLAQLRDVPDAAAHLQCNADGCRFWPTYEGLAAMSAAARTLLYARLATTTDNPQNDDTFYRAVELGPFSAVPSMPPEAQPLVDALTWNSGGVPSFSDLGTVCARLGSPALCQSFVRALLSRRSATVSLRLTDDAAVERFTAEFPPYQRSAVRARLVAARAAHEATVPLTSLLPEWAQQRVDTFPVVGEDWTNCYWSVLRFVNDANGQVASGPALDAILARDFARIPAATQVGDVVVLRDATGDIIHAATRLLGGYMFTKNGHGRFQAWRIIPMTDLTADYWQVTTIETWRRR